MSSTANDEDIFILPVKLTNDQLKEAFLVSVSDKDNGMYKYERFTCAICLETVHPERDGVYLDCEEHAFHAKCIVPHLQRDHRCPTCRSAPSNDEEESDDDSSSSSSSYLAQPRELTVEERERQREEYEKFIGKRSMEAERRYSSYLEEHNLEDNESSRYMWEAHKSVYKL